MYFLTRSGRAGVGVTDQIDADITFCSYDAWGQERDADDWSPLSDPINDNLELTTDRGFTGHEMLSGLDLIHMNDRIYDPVIGRMLSPDSAVMEPGNLQSFNRYSYVMNNPLTLSVDSGFTKSGLENLLASSWNNDGRGRGRRDSPLLSEPITNDPLSEQDKLNTLSSSRDSKAEKLTWTDWEWVDDGQGGGSYESSETTTYSTTTKIEYNENKGEFFNSSFDSDDILDYGLNMGSINATKLTQNISKSSENGISSSVVKGPADPEKNPGLAKVADAINWLSQSTFGKTDNGRQVVDALVSLYKRKRIGFHVVEGGLPKAWVGKYVEEYDRIFMVHPDPRIPQDLWTLVALLAHEGTHKVDALRGELNGDLYGFDDEREAYDNAYSVALEYSGRSLNPTTDQEIWDRYKDKFTDKTKPPSVK